MSNKFSIDFFSDSQYEQITVEISYNDQILCQLNKDKGIQHIEVEFFYDSRVLPEQVDIRFPLEEFLKVLETAKEDLINA